MVHAWEMSYQPRGDPAGSAAEPAPSDELMWHQLTGFRSRPRKSQEGRYISNSPHPGASLSSEARHVGRAASGNAALHWHLAS